MLTLNTIESALAVVTGTFSAISAGGSLIALFNQQFQVKKDEQKLAIVRSQIVSTVDPRVKKSYLNIEKLIQRRILSAFLIPWKRYVTNMIGSFLGLTAVFSLAYSGLLISHTMVASILSLFILGYVSFCVWSLLMDNQKRAVILNGEFEKIDADQLKVERDLGLTTLYLSVMIVYSIICVAIAVYIVVARGDWGRLFAIVLIFTWMYSFAIRMLNFANRPRLAKSRFDRTQSDEPDFKVVGAKFLLLLLFLRLARR
ncbi:hypothetical protein [Corynebacterium dentalis]|uniref:hypothetical protein n=1 Tax=Corynebacterium dentalis TaxID=2014528 RepID=UPI00370DE187